jgi:hypothetical protein
MQEAIKMAQEVAEKLEQPINEESHSQHMDRLKPEINNMLHTYLPDHLTVKQVEILANVINEMIWNPERFLSASAGNGA